MRERGMRLALIYEQKFAHPGIDKWFIVAELV